MRHLSHNKQTDIEMLSHMLDDAYTAHDPHLTVYAFCSRKGITKQQLSKIVDAMSKILSLSLEIVPQHQMPFSGRMSFSKHQQMNESIDNEVDYQKADIPLKKMGLTANFTESCKGFDKKIFCDVIVSDEDKFENFIRQVIQW